MTDVLFLGSKITADRDCSHGITRFLLLERKAMRNLDSMLKSRHITLPTKVNVSQSYGFYSSHVQMWEVDHKVGLVPKNWCFQIVALEKTLESPLDCKEIKPVNSEVNRPWIFILRTVAEAEAPTHWTSDAKGRVFGKEPDAGKDWRQKETGEREDEMVR